MVKMVLCTICGDNKEYDSIDEFNKHMLTEHDAKQSTTSCSECGQTFMSSATLNLHLIHKHNKYIDDNGQLIEYSQEEESEDKTEDVAENDKSVGFEKQMQKGNTILTNHICPECSISQNVEMYCPHYLESVPEDAKLIGIFARERANQTKLIINNMENIRNVINDFKKKRQDAIDEYRSINGLSFFKKVKMAKYLRVLNEMNKQYDALADLIGIQLKPNYVYKRTSSGKLIKKEI